MIAWLLYIAGWVAISACALCALLALAYVAVIAHNPDDYETHGHYRSAIRQHLGIAALMSAAFVLGFAYALPELRTALNL